MTSRPESPGRVPRLWLIELALVLVCVLSLAGMQLADHLVASNHVAAVAVFVAALWGAFASTVLLSVLATVHDGALDPSHELEQADVGGPRTDPPVPTVGELEEIVFGVDAGRWPWRPPGRAS